jgi:hypothetical protein
MNDELREDTQATAEEVISQAEQLIALERRKAEPGTDPERAEQLAEDSESLAHEIARKTTVEKRLTEQANQS